MIKKKSLNEILADALGYLVEHSNITMTSPGSTARALVEAIASEAVSLGTALDVAMVQAFVSSASGLYLDLLGEMVGIRRRAEVASYTLSSDKNIKFYVTSGVLGDEVPKPGDSTKALIPTSTQITTTDGLATFVTDTDYETSANATEVYVTARAMDVGPNSNVGPGTLSTHDIAAPGLLVTNMEAVENGTDIETDESLRLRVRTSVRVAEQANEAAIRLAALSVGGVSDVRVTEHIDGSGSFEILLVPDGNRVPTGSLGDVANKVQDTVAFGTKFYVREPEYVPIAMDIELSMPTVAELDKPLLRDLAGSAILNYVGSLGPSDELVVNRIKESALSVSNQIRDVHVRSVRVKGRPQLIANIRLLDDQVFIPDTNETKPILVV